VSDKLLAGERKKKKNNNKKQSKHNMSPKLRLGGHNNYQKIVEGGVNRLTFQGESTRGEQVIGTKRPGTK
jgi:hypothetical protein